VRAAATAERAWDGTGCPFQVAKLCGVHAIRPFGCRMFFCDPASTQWQNDAYERYHARLKQLHETLGCRTSTSSGATRCGNSAWPTRRRGRRWRGATPRFDTRTRRRLCWRHFDSLQEFDTEAFNRKARS
jgi:hypothetical protein